MADVYAFRCRPVFKERVWGGRRLADRLGKKLPPDQAIGEAWEVADLPEGTSTVDSGAREGTSLHDLTREWGSDLVGTGWPADAAREGRFPLLVKFLDAQDNLSVQVHPSDEDCEQHFPDDHGKDESWIVLDSEPDASIIFGFHDDVVREDFERRIENDTVNEVLRHVAVRRGDVVRVAPGTVHAIGEGVMILEIQQPSDTTFRIYDYGRGREVHIEQAKKVVRLTTDEDPRVRVDPVRRSWGQLEALVDVPAYRIERLFITEKLSWTVDPKSVQVFIPVAGGGELRWDGGSLHVKTAETALLPAALGDVTFQPAGPATVVLAGAGGVELCGAE